MEDRKDSLSRRNVLRATAGLTGFGFTTSIGLAKQSTEADEDEIYHQALRLREQTGSYKEFKKYLEAHGFVTKHKQETKVVDYQEESDGFSTEMILFEFHS